MASGTLSILACDKVNLKTQAFEKDAILLLRLLDRLSLKLFIWLSLATQIGIVVTGGLVRLTGSGLGCPTWPKCTDESLVTVPAQGYHGLIEFGNRMLTFVLLVVSVLTLILVWKARVDLRKLAIALLLGIPAQAVLGGFTVLFKLNPWFVGGHFVLSALLIAIAALLVWRFYAPKNEQTPALANAMTVWVTGLGAVSVLIGVVVTGAGPHSGDAATPRNGLDLEIWQHYHSYPAYALLLLVLLQRAALWKIDKKFTLLASKVNATLLILLIAQAILGVLQSRLGVPPVLVILHMLGASLIIATLTFNQLALRKR